MHSQATNWLGWAFPDFTVDKAGGVARTGAARRLGGEGFEEEHSKLGRKFDFPWMCNLATVQEKSNENQRK